MVVEDWGLIDYNEAWRRQNTLADAILRSEAPDTLVFCEHPPVVTFGRSTKPGSFRTPVEELQKQGVQIVEVNRGGEATVHNPGQIVGYPIVNLQNYTPDLHWFLRAIEDTIINSLAQFGLASGRYPGYTGVWLQESRKICAIGFHCKQWVTTHGFALNIDNDLSLFDDIIPCGIEDKAVTSLQRELLQVPSREELKASLLSNIIANLG